MKQRWISSAAVACSLLILAACGGGSGSSAGGSIPSAPSGGAPQSGLSATATFIVTVPHKSTSSSARSAKYITPSVQGIDFSVTAAIGAGNPPPSPAPPVNRGYVFYALTPQATYCTNGPTALTCTLSVQAYPGTDLITVNTYDQPNPSTPGSNGGFSNIISTGFVTATIAAGVANTISLVTQGVVSNIQLALDTPFPAMGAALTQNLHITATDADSSIIIGNYDLPLAVADNDPSGATSVSTAPVTSSSVVPTVTYNGNTMPNAATITVQTTSPYSAQNNSCCNPATVRIQGGASGISSNPSSLLFASKVAAAQTITISATGAAGPGPFTATPNQDVNHDPSCQGIAAVSGTSPTFTITPVGPGSCWLAVGSSSANTGVPITVARPLTPQPAPPATWAFGGSTANLTATPGSQPALVSLSAYQNVSATLQFGTVSSGSGTVVVTDAINPASGGDITPATLPPDNATPLFVPVLYISAYNGTTNDIALSSISPAITVTKSPSFGGATTCELDTFSYHGTSTRGWGKFLGPVSISGNTVTFPSGTLPPGNTVTLDQGQGVIAVACQ